MADRAETPVQYHSSRCLQRRHITIGKVYHRDLAGGRRGVGHLFGLAVVDRQWLLAEHMLASAEYLHCCGIMRAIRRDIGDSVKLPPSKGVIERCESERDTMPEREGPQPDLVRIDGSDNFDAGDFREIHGVGICPSSGSENDQAHFCPHGLCRIQR